MKKTTILSFLLFAAIGLFAQQTPFLQLLEKKGKKVSLGHKPKTTARSSVPKQRLDALVFSGLDNGQTVTNGKFEFIYDSLQIPVEEISYYTNGQQQVVPEAKTTYTYDANQSIVEELYFTWNAVTNEFSPEARFTYEYDANGALVTEKYDLYSAAFSSWDPSSLTEYTYNSQGDIFEIVTSTFDDVLMQYTVDSKDEYIYQGDQLVKINEYITFAGDLLLGSAIEYEYGTNGKLAKETYLQNNVFGGSLTPFLQIQYTYDSQDRLLETIDYSQSFTPGILEPTSKYQRSYDTQGNIESETYYDFDDNTQAFVGQSKFDYFFENSYIYDDLLLPNAYRGEEIAPYFSHQITGGQAYESDGSGWVETETYQFFWSEQEVSSQHTPVTNPTQIYPNPLSDQFVVNLGQALPDALLQLYNAQGQLVLEQTLNQQVTLIEAGQLPVGLYQTVILDKEAAALHTGKLSVVR